MNVGKLGNSPSMVLPSNTVFNISSLVHLLTIFDVLLGYDLKCPLALQWNVRSTYLCIVELRYICLYDDVKGNFTESCNGPLPFIAKGYTWIIRGNPDRDKCSQSTYQPYKHRNFKSSDCVYKKSLCSEKGQVILDTGNNTDDHTCRCDYRRGYDFVVKPRNQCYCYPSNEDCSCYIRQCDNTNNSLSQDYQCKDTFNTTTVCTPIKEDIDNGFQPERFTRFRQNDTELDWPLISITIWIVCVPAVVLPLVLVAIHMYQYSHRHIICSQLQSLTCRFGEDATFKCTLTEIDGSSHMPCWFKDNKESETFSHWQTISNNHKHALVITAVSFEDEGPYTIKVKNDTSHANLKVEDKLSINSEDIYYVLSVHAICKIAIPAVRKVFDIEFKPDDLSRIVRENKDKLRPLQKQNAITKDQWRLLNGDRTTSKDLGLRLMVFLLRNITNYEIKNQLPPENDKSEVDDLCRIDYYRNIFAHYQERMSDSEFKLCLKDIIEAAQRLTGVQHNWSPTAISPQPCNDSLCTPDELTLALKGTFISK